MQCPDNRCYLASSPVNPAPNIKCCATHGLLHQLPTAWLPISTTKITTYNILESCVQCMELTWWHYSRKHVWISIWLPVINNGADDKIPNLLRVRFLSSTNPSNENESISCVCVIDKCAYSCTTTWWPLNVTQLRCRRKGERTTSSEHGRPVFPYKHKKRSNQSELLVGLLCVCESSVNHAKAFVNWRETAAGCCYCDALLYDLHAFLFVLLSTRPTQSPQMQLRNVQLTHSWLLLERRRRRAKSSVSFA